MKDILGSPHARDPYLLMKHLPWRPKPKTLKGQPPSLDFKSYSSCDDLASWLQHFGQHTWDPWHFALAPTAFSPQLDYSFRSHFHAHFAVGFRTLALRYCQDFRTSGFGSAGERRVFAVEGGRGGGGGVPSLVTVKPKAQTVVMVH